MNAKKNKPATLSGLATLLGRHAAEDNKETPDQKAPEGFTNMEMDEIEEFLDGPLDEEGDDYIVARQDFVAAWNAYKPGN